MKVETTIRYYLTPIKRLKSKKLTEPRMDNDAMKTSMHFR